MVQDILWEERVDARIDRREATACWPWTGALDKDGKPFLRPRRVTRFIYERSHGKVPPGFIIGRADHQPECIKRTCLHNLCMNPAHMTIERRWKSPGRPPQVICRRGHDMTVPENVYLAAGRRWCLECKRVARADWERRNPNYYTRRYRARRRHNEPQDS